MSRTNWLYLRRKSRRVEAKIRQEEYDGLTSEQKVARAESRRGNSEKELGRLGATG